MRTPLTIAIASMLLLGGCTPAAEQKPQAPSLMEASRLELATALKERDQLLILVKEISESMERIKRLEEVMSIGGSRSTEDPVRRARILADIAALQRTLADRRKQLADLEGRLLESELYTDELRATVAVMRAQLEGQTRETEALRRQLTQAHRTIDSLSTEVDSLNTTVASVNEERDSARATSERLATELNTCFYVAATKSALKDHHILETGFLRKPRLMQGDYDQTFFNRADKRTLRSLHLGRHKGQLLTNHPAGSYTMVDDGGERTMMISDPDQFWSLTNYLVIQID